MPDQAPDPALLTALAAIPKGYADPDPSKIAQLPRGNTKLSYEGHADITLDLIEIDPLWDWRPAAFDTEGLPLVRLMGKRLVLWGYLRVHGVERMCVGTCDDTKGDPEKELIGDLLRNGAMRFGIATRLWSKADRADPAGSDEAGGYERPSRPAQQPRAPRNTPRAATATPNAPAAPERLSRTPQEASMRATLERLTPEAVASVRAEFKARFGSTLTDLDPGRHQEAAEWMSDHLASEQAAAVQSEG